MRGPFCKQGCQSVILHLNLQESEKFHLPETVVFILDTFFH